MEGLTLSTKEQSRLQILNGVLERYWSMKEAVPLLGVSERQGWRLLASFIGRTGPPVWHTRTGAECAQRHRGEHRATSGGPGPGTLWRHQPHSPDRVVGRTGGSDVVPPHCEEAADQGRVVQPTPTTAATEPMSKATDAPRKGCCSRWTGATISGWRIGGPG